MWQSYLPQARALLGAIATIAPSGTDTETWRKMIGAALEEGGDA